MALRIRRFGRCFFLEAGPGTVLIKGENVAVTRILANTDYAGSRTAVTLALPA